MPHILEKHYPVRSVIFFLGEGLWMVLALNLVYFLSGEIGQFIADFWLYFLRASIVTLIFQICLYYFDLYDLAVVPSISENTTRLTQAFGFGCIALALLYYLFPVIIISTKVFWSAFVAICVTITLWRFLYFWVLERQFFTQHIAIIGTDLFAKDIKDVIEGNQDSGYKIVAYVGDNKPGFLASTDIVFSEQEGLRDLCQQGKIEKIVLALDERRGRLPMHELIAYKFMGVEIIDGVQFFEELTGKIPVEKVNPSCFLFSKGFYISRLTLVLKRLLDIVVSVIGLILSLPLLFISAFIIKLESPGPLFYRQYRVGRGGNHFEVIKFRSMCVDAEKEGAVWAAKNDNRVTRYGNIMRKIRIDEIPQMLNVLKGEMSFVGPRPERPVFVRELVKSIPFYPIRHVVKPGITGWAQVYYPYGASEEDALRKLEYDLFYLKHMSLSMDLFVIFQTVKIVLFLRGSR